MKEKFNRREFLKKSAAAGAGMFVAAVAPKVMFANKEDKKGDSGGKAPKGEVMTLDIMSPLSEYEGPYREIWSVYEEENPNVKINLFSINEDTAAAHEAKVAGGFLPGFECTSFSAKTIIR